MGEVEPVEAGPGVGFDFFDGGGVGEGVDGDFVVGSEFVLDRLPYDAEEVLTGGAYAGCARHVIGATPTGADAADVNAQFAAQ